MFNRKSLVEKSKSLIDDLKKPIKELAQLNQALLEEDTSLDVKTGKVLDNIDSSIDELQDQIDHLENKKVVEAEGFRVKSETLMSQVNVNNKIISKFEQLFA